MGTIKDLQEFNEDKTLSTKERIQKLVDNPDTKVKVTTEYLGETQTFSGEFIAMIVGHYLPEESDDEGVVVKSENVIQGHVSSHILCDSIKAMYEKEFGPMGDILQASSSPDVVERLFKAYLEHQEESKKSQEKSTDTIPSKSPHWSR